MNPEQYKQVMTLVDRLETYASRTGLTSFLSYDSYETARAILTNTRRELYDYLEHITFGTKEA